ncbi:hypothetical protein TNCV_2242501 [Trichonephila clavipes]|nr:hypothetical protein TNCV_2242501 [Trichonephila clavipes]
MNICKCIVPLRHGATINSRRAASPLVRLVEGEAYAQDVLLKTGVEPSQIILSLAWCSKLRITTGVQLAPYYDEFRGP